MGIIETIKMITLEEGIEKGIEKGIEQGRHEEQILFVTSLLTKTDFDIPIIASLSGVSEDFVNQIRQNLAQ